jgi:GTP-binding protein EngB required for normal cell division
MALFNGPQSRAILCCFLDIHRRMAELEAAMHTDETPTAFSAHVNDLAPAEAKVIRDYFARIRNAMLSHLNECQIPLEARPTSLRWALETGLGFLNIAVESLRPARLIGYGALGPQPRLMSTKACEDLDRLIDQVAAYVRQGLGRDLRGRLKRLEKAQVGVDALTRLEEVIARWQLVEFRPPLQMIVDRLENPSFEIAVFGRVSCGKSSLLNHVAGIDALPVGVTPVTAVPTRLVSGDPASVMVAFAESKSREVGLEHLWEYASEEGNRGNEKHVTGIVVTLPSPRLHAGVAFVDTPGVGSLALAGGAETLAYLPRCDLGVVLVDSASSLAREDLALLRSLYEAAIPAMVLLSKADLLGQEDRGRLTDYIQTQIRRELGLELAVFPVSTVGAHESLLNAWFEEQLTPLLDRHRVLAEASLRRKTVHLCESVAATLATLRSKHSRGSPEIRVEAGAAQRCLDAADVAIRRARDQSSNWWEGRRAIAEDLPRRVAHAVVATPGEQGSVAAVAVIERDLLDRGQQAHAIVAALQETLAATLERLAGTAPLAHADASAVRGFHGGGLPALGLDDLAEHIRPIRPWWSAMVPPLAVRAVERSIRAEWQPAITEAVQFHDRQLESWLKAKLARLIELYEARAGAFREQIRRLVAEPLEGGLTVDDAALEADLRRLRDAGAQAGSAAEESSPSQMATASVEARGASRSYFETRGLVAR